MNQSMEKYLAVKKRFEEQEDRENAVKMSRYMRELFPFYGLPTPKRRALYRDFLRQEKKAGRIDWTFLDQCYADGHREFQYLAGDYLRTMQDLLTYEDIPKIRTYIKAKQWWDTIDLFDQVVGRIGLQDSRVDDLMLEWSLDEDFWLRRIAIDHQLGRKEKTNTELLEKILVNNLGSREFFINKAIGWSLRDYSKTDPEWVWDFIRTYGEKMDKLSVREGSKYL